MEHQGLLSLRRKESKPRVSRRRAFPKHRSPQLAEQELMIHIQMPLHPYPHPDNTKFESILNFAKKTVLLFLVLAAPAFKDRLCRKAEPQLPSLQAVAGISDLHLPKHFHGAQGFVLFCGGVRECLQRLPPFLSLGLHFFLQTEGSEFGDP